jgi:hypothetical protein
MWSRLNVVWLRRRWASQEDDPGRRARVARPEKSSGGGNGRKSVAEAVRRELYARSVIIDCTHADCAGMFLTGAREINHLRGSGSRVVLRCTRHPDDHELTVSIEPCTPEEVERLKASLFRGERLACVRCGTPLELGSVEAKDGWAKSLDSGAAFHCPWCGVSWAIPADMKGRVG